MAINRTVWVILGLVGLLWGVGQLGCSDDLAAGNGNGTGDDDGAGTDGDSAGAGSHGGSGSSLDSDTAAGGRATGTGDSAEVCDGVDNDGNGIVDDVDAGGDGICDCLHIGTIGRIGPWSNGGNIFTTWLEERSPIAAVNLGDDELTSQVLDGLDVIVVLRADTAALAEDNSPAHHQFSAAEVDAIEAWVRAGGGLMTTIGYQGNESAEVQNVNRLLAPFGVGYQDSSPYLDLTGFVEQWMTHPIANGVSRINTNNGVEPMPDGGEVVATGAGDRVAMVATGAGDGHVILWGDEWITYDSEWTDVADQQVELLWVNMIKWLTPSRECQVAVPPILLD